MYTGTETPYTYTKHYNPHSTPGERIPVHQIRILNRDMGIQIECKYAHNVSLMFRETSLDVWDMNSGWTDVGRY